MNPSFSREQLSCECYPGMNIRKGRRVLDRETLVMETLNF